MPIFRIDKNKLLPIKEKKFDLEKDIQKITEENLETVFGYKFVCSEFAHNNLRIDTLAFDTESNSFVIIEYKKDRNLSVIDQGLANHRRIEILDCIASNDGIILENIAENLNCNIKTISEHTRRLHQAGLVNKKYYGRAVMHSLSPYGKQFYSFINKF